MTDRHLITGQRIKTALLERAKELRRNMTPAEKRLWAALRDNRIEGYHFRRQQIIGPFIVDFYCDTARLVLEVDGPIHESQHEYDQERDQTLNAFGLQVLHIQNDQIMNDLESTFSLIRDALRPNPPTPFPPREGGDSPPRNGEGPGVGSLIGEGPGLALRETNVVGSDTRPNPPTPFPPREGGDSPPRYGEGLEAKQT